MVHGVSVDILICLDMTEGRRQIGASRMEYSGNDFYIKILVCIRNGMVKIYTTPGL